MSSQNKEKQTTSKSDQEDQATPPLVQPPPKVMVSKGVQTTDTFAQVEEAVKEVLEINPELQNNPEFQKLFLKK